MPTRLTLNVKGSLVYMCPEHGEVIPRWTLCSTTSRSGARPYCKFCNNLNAITSASKRDAKNAKTRYNRTYYERHREERRVAFAAYWSKNRERLLASQRLRRRHALMDARALELAK